MEYTIVGKIINTHGVRGEVRVYPYTHDIKRFSYLYYVYIGEEKIKVELDKVRYHKGAIIIKFLDYDNINQVLPFKGEYIYVDEENKIVLPDNYYFIQDLMGCEVVDMAGNKIGYVDDILQYSANDIYLVKGKNNKEYLIPAVGEFVKDINIRDKRIVINPIEGMIE